MRARTTMLSIAVMAGWLLSGVAVAAPTLTITSPADGATVSDTITVTVSASGFGTLTKVEFKLDGVKQLTDTTAPWEWRWDTTTATVGAHTLSCRGNDGSTKKWYASAPITVTVVRSDTTPPTGSLRINDDAPYATSPAVTLSLTATDAESGVTQMQCSNDNVTYAAPEAYATSKAWTLASGDGVKTVYAKFQNGAGLWSAPVSATITLDATPPSTPTINPVTSPTNQVNQTLTGTKEADTAIWLNGNAIVAQNNATTWSYTAPLAEGTNTVAFTAKDAAGNVSPAATVTVLRDTVAPVISSTAASELTSTTATITWSTDEPASARVEYGATASYGLTTTLDAALVTSHRMALTGLTPATTYHTRVRSADAAGNEQLGTDVTLTTTPAPDTTPPMGTLTINDDAAFTAETAVTLTLAATDAEGAVTLMRFSNDGQTYAASVPYAPTASWTLASGDGAQTVTAQFQDATGNWSAAATDTITLDTTPPATPAVTDDGDTTSATDRLHARWSADDADSGIAEYQWAIGTSPGAADVLGWLSVGADTEGTRSGLALQPEARYYVSVKARNGAGLWSNAGSSDGIIVLPAEPPQVRISAPTDAFATNAPTQDVAGAITAAAGVHDVTMRVTTGGVEQSPMTTPVTDGLFRATVSLEREGAATIRVDATDIGGRTGSAAVTGMVDRTPPALDVTSPPPGTLFTDD